MKIALVHDYLSQDGGAEKVLEAFHEIWPDAPIYVLFHDEDEITQFKDAEVKESFLSKFPFSKSKYQWYLPLMPMATESHNLDEFDVVLSSTSAFAKGILTPPSTLHISYCHTPTRYLWTETHEYIEDLNYNPLIKKMLPTLIHRLRMWDKMSTDRVDQFLCNSETVRKRINNYYRRESKVIYPPVETSKYGIAENTEDYFLAGGRLVAYKKFDLLVEVFNRLGWNLKIFGSGPEEKKLKKRSKSNIDILGRVSEEKKIDLYQHAQAFLHPQVEDLGLTVIESMASGRPVIAYNEGGAKETVIPGKTGVFFNKQSWDSLLDTIINFETGGWNSSEIRRWAQNFSKSNFKQKLKEFVYDRYEEHKKDLNQSKIELKERNEKEDESREQVLFSFSKVDTKTES
ncbi:MAG: glycosyltransferase [Candidatus Magasanikbacteria bacterium]